MKQVSRRDLALTMGAGTLVLAHPSQARARTIVRPMDIMDTLINDPLDGRPIKVRLFAPVSRSRRKHGFIVFSHGANSSGALYDALLRPLAESGFVIAAPTHVDSETNPDRANFNQAKVLETRMRDLQILADARANLAAQVGISGRQFDPQATIIAGHSFGALLALYLVGAGQVPIGTAAGAAPVSTIYPLYRGAIAISPPGPVPGLLKAEQFDTIAKPVLISTGEKDVLPGFVPEWQMRLAAFERPKSAPAYAAILPDVDHYFGGAIGRLTVAGPAQTQSLSTTTQVAALFARAYGNNDRAALRELDALTRRPSRFPQLDLRRRN